jgi:hypothetical protein
MPARGLADVIASRTWPRPFGGLREPVRRVALRLIYQTFSTLLG